MADSTEEGGTALWYVAPGRAEMRTEKLGPLAAGQVRIRALFGAFSRGTEALVLAGRVPESEFKRMRAPFMGGEFPFPVKYGYATVGRIEAGPGNLRHRTVFVLHPHQTLFDVPAEAVAIVPEGVPPKRAVLAANMETALNGLWDGAPAASDRIAVVGAGVIGSLVGFLCNGLAGAEVTLVDSNPSRAALAGKLGVGFAEPRAAPRDCDVVFHASGNPAGLAAALELAGDEATIVEMSWYGTAEVSLKLGGAFHSRRLKLISSQVGQVAPSHRPRWTRERRLAAALQLLADPRLDALLATPVRFDDLADRVPGILGAKSNVLCQVIEY